MAALIAKTTIQCNTCGCSLARRKTFRVEAGGVEAAKQEARSKVAEWKRSLAGQNCRICTSILKEEAAS